MILKTAEEFQEGQILLLDKPLTWSSFQAVNKVKWALIKNLHLPKKFKIGHAGTLDPLASGLLISLYREIHQKNSRTDGHG